MRQPLNSSVPCSADNASVAGQLNSPGRSSQANKLAARCQSYQARSRFVVILQSGVLLVWNTSSARLCNAVASAATAAYKAHLLQWLQKRT